MAVLKNLSEFEGPIGNINAYKRRDSDKTYLRTKGGASKKEIKTHQAFKRTRELNTEWSGCSKASALVRNLLVHQQPAADYNLSATLTAIAKNMQARDTANEPGKRPILFSRFGQMLEGFQLNRKTSFESVIKGHTDVRLLRTEAKAVIQLPELIHGISFLPPVTLPVFRICISFGSLPDMYYLPSGYAISAKDFDEHHQQTGTIYETAWYYNGSNVAAQTIELAIEPSAGIQPQDALMVAISVNFGTPVTDQLIKTNKYVGAGKLLKVDLNKQ